MTTAVVDAVSRAGDAPSSRRRGAPGGFRITALVLGIAAISALPALAAAQTQLDVHGNWARTTATHTTSWGAGIGLQAVVAGKSSPIALSAAPSFDYLKQENSGPAQEILSLDLDLQPGGSGTVIPYVGASAGANWSTGSGKQWEGTKLGLETLGGVQLKVGASALSLKGEERFGYVRGQEHTLTTRFGVLISM